MQPYILLEDCTQRKSSTVRHKNFWHLFLHNDGYLLLRRTASPILSDDHDRVFAGFQRLREKTESSIASNARDRLPIDDQRSAGFRFAEDLHHAPVQLRA